MSRFCSHTSVSVNVDWRGGGTRTELLMETLQPKKANNLEIIKLSLRLEIERRAPVSNSFGSAPFINSAEYLRTQSKKGKKLHSAV